MAIYECMILKLCNPCSPCRLQRLFSLTLYTFYPWACSRGTAHWCQKANRNSRWSPCPARNRAVNYHVLYLGSVCVCVCARALIYFIYNSCSREQQSTIEFNWDREWSEDGRRSLFTALGVLNLQNTVKNVIKIKWVCKESLISRQI